MSGEWIFDSDPRRFYYDREILNEATDPRLGIVPGCDAF